MGNVYETLTRYNMPGVEPFIVPGLATEWTVSEDGMTWTFNLREGVKFHDGSRLQFRSSQVHGRAQHDLNQCSAYIYSAVETIETPDPYTVVFHLSEPAPMDAILASVYNAWITSPSAKDKDAAWFNAGNDAGTGPYRMAQFEPGQRMVLERFDDYWRGWNGERIRQGRFRVGRGHDYRRADAAGRPTGLRHQPGADAGTDGQPGCRRGPRSQLQRRAMATGIFSWTNVVPLSTMYWCARRLAYSFPYDSVLANTDLGKGTRAHGVVPVTVWGHDPEPLPYSFDLEKAKALLAEAGYADWVRVHVEF